MNRKRILKKINKEYYKVEEYNNNNILISQGEQLFDQKNKEPIYLLTQFFIPDNAKRYNEIKESLKRNINNNYIEKIYLLNERIYSQEELDIHNNKLEQVNLQKRLSFLDCINYIRKINLKGYFIISNSDIFFDNTIANLQKTRMHLEPIMQSLLRYEFRDENNLEECPIFGNRSDSQDSWIFHSNFIGLLDSEKKYNIKLGILGCDQSINYLFHKAGFKLFNNPSNFRSYHYHDALLSERDYIREKIKPIPMPYLYLKPNLK